jgi:hypothetical protein
LPFTIFGKSSLIKSNCPDGERKKENLKLTNAISSLITDDLKKNTKHECFEHAAQITIFQGSIIIIIVILSTNLNKKFHKKGWILKISSLQ